MIKDSILLVRIPDELMTGLEKLAHFYKITKSDIVRLFIFLGLSSFDYDDGDEWKPQ